MSAQAVATEGKKKRATKRHLGGYIRKLQEDRTEEGAVRMGMNSSANKIFNSLAEIAVDKVARAAANLLLVSKKEIVKEKVMRAAVVLVFGVTSKLAENVDTLGSNAVATFEKSLVDKASQGTGKMIIARKSGLIINPGRIDKRFRREIDHKDAKDTKKKRVRVSASAYVYLAGVIEQLLVELILLSEDMVKQEGNRQRIKPWHIVQSVRHDVELNKLLGHVLLTGGSTFDYLGSRASKLEQENA